MPTILDLAEPYLPAWGWQALATWFADKRELTQAEIFHCSENKFDDIFRINLVDAVAFGETG
jgi:hypothetical protein